ncbi:alpha/beta fold hydrolase [Carnobacterium gallinarum]|uniref:alpha/beta fold hydrolase n=1 Tax=Carnobacterium gallinarum TaxID=2749 RepID=UPI000553190C|nr:alpha/beta fold hydrolase [Carnobacterium gallinarum]
MKISVRHRFIKKIPVLEVVGEELKGDVLPLIVYYHGWQSSKELVLTQARKLAQKGIRVILPDAMHHGERKTGSISMIPSITFWSSIHYNLAEFSLLVTYFQKANLIEGNRIGVGGVSMGGITTCALLTQHPEIQAAACMMGTPAPLNYIQRVIASAKAREIDVPKDLVQLLSWVEHYDLSAEPQKINQRPLLFWHGTEDEKIPYEDAHDFYKKVENEVYAKNIRFLTEEGEGHLVRGEVMDQVVDFFAIEL